MEVLDPVLAYSKGLAQSPEPVPVTWEAEVGGLQHSTIMSSKKKLFDIDL